MNPSVLQAPTLAVRGGEDTASLRLHAHCTAGSPNGSVTVSFSNMAETETFYLQFAPLGSRVEYHLAPTNQTEGVDARKISLNGDPLVVGDATTLPDLAGRVVSGLSDVIVAPLSLGYIVFPSALAAACM
jgi:hypothetical protein